MDQRLTGDAGTQKPVSIQDCSRRLVAGRLDGEYDRVVRRWHSYLVNPKRWGRLGRSSALGVNYRMRDLVLVAVLGTVGACLARQSSLLRRLRRLRLSAALSVNHDTLHRVDCSIQLRIPLAIGKLLIVW